MAQSYISNKHSSLDPSECPTMSKNYLSKSRSVELVSFTDGTEINRKIKVGQFHKICFLEYFDYILFTGIKICLSEVNSTKCGSKMFCELIHLAVKARVHIAFRV